MSGLIAATASAVDGVPDAQLAADAQLKVAKVKVHLDDCGGCEDNFVLEERFLARVRDCCQEDVAPLELRTRIVARLRMEHDTPQ